MQSSERILAPQALEERRVEVQRHDDFVAPLGGLGHEQLLVRYAGACGMRQRCAVGDQEGGDVVSDVYVVDAPEQMLQTREEHPSVREGGPAGGGGVDPEALQQRVAAGAAGLE